MKKKNILIICELIIILALIAIIILLLCNNKENNNKRENNNKEENNKITETVRKDIIEKYAELTYKNQTELETLVSYKKEEEIGQVSAYIDALFEIKDGKLIATAKDGSKFEGKVHIDPEDTNKTIVIKGIDENIIAIADFNVHKYGGPTSSIVVLTENGKIYRKDAVEMIDNELTLEFKRINIENKVKGLFVNEKYEESNDTKNLLYILTEDEKLYYLEGYSTETSKLGFTYEERVINYQPHQNYGFAHISIYKADNTGEITKLNKETIKIQYNNEILKIKSLFITVSQDHYSKLYVVDENGNIYTTIKAISILEINKPEYDITKEYTDEYYKLEKYNNKKVTNVEYTNKEILKIEYEDGTAETIQKPDYGIEYFYNV